MKAVLMSIHPQWCEKIFNGSKTIEVRKSRPSIETPFKVYVYCTKHGDYKYRVRLDENRLAIPEVWNGKVIGSFVCGDIISDWKGEHSDEFVKYALLSLDAQKKYGGNKPLYGWHITEPELFDKPREITEFYKPCPFNEDCDISCPYAEGEYHGDGINGDVEFIGCNNKITRAPQSWVYVEEEE